MKHDKIRPALRFLPALLLLGLTGATAAAAPPNVNYLFPAGGQRGKTVEVTASGTYSSWPVKVWVSGRGVTAAAGKQKGKLNVTIAADAVPGVYWLRTYDEQGGGNLRPFIVGTLPEVAEKEPNDELREAQRLDVPGVVVNGRLGKAGDVDCFSMALKKGQTLVASLEANHTLKSPMDAILQVLSAKGFVLEQNHDYHGLDPQVVFDVPEDGIYIVRVIAFPSEPDSSIRFSGGDNYIYRLTMTTGGFAEHALPLAVFDVESARVALSGWNIPDSARALSVSAPDETANGLVWLHHPEVANSVPLRVEPHPTHDLTAMDKSKRGGPYLPPCTLTGRVERSRSAAGFRIVGKKGQPLQFEVEARALGFALTPMVRVLDPEGKQLVRAEPAKLDGDVELSFNPPRDGEYRVEVHDLYDGSGARYLYCLRIVRPEPDFALRVSTDRFQVVPGKPLDVPVQVVRLDGFAGEVALSVEGLPAGMTAATVGKTDGGTIMLRISAEKVGAASAFRVVGQAKGRKRLAAASIKEFERTTTELWVSAVGSVTVTKPVRKKK
jgi:hypothetical protein